ncbi:hypothetical protein AAFO92_07355 [Roseovarius sp. CAU 1744]|uniref:hypothetical protein n=1 Tax=Roseovarius sp. CAU 1744 TaxID=3140368 RepID=UPI00325BCC37
MLLLAGLMGILAIGATALVWFETAPRPADEQGNAAAADTPDTDISDDESEYVTDMGGSLACAAPPVDPAAIARDVDRRLRGGPRDGQDATCASIAEPGMTGATSRSAGLSLDEGAVGAEFENDGLLQAHQENVTGFSPQRDKLVVVFDDQVDPDPRLELQRDAADSAHTHVALNGVRIATVDVVDGLTLDHITLVPESSLGNPAYAPPQNAAA